MNDVLKELIAASVAIEARICAGTLRDSFGDILPWFSDAINAAIGSFAKSSNVQTGVTAEVFA